MAQEHDSATWSGIALRIGYDSNFLESDRAHLEIEVPDRQPISVTETGYRSHFTSTEEIAAAGGPVEYVLALLDVAAKKGVDGAMRWRVVAPVAAKAPVPVPEADPIDTRQLALFG